MLPGIRTHAFHHVFTGRFIAQICNNVGAFGCRRLGA